MKKDYVQMFNILEKYLKDKVQDIDLTILEAVNARKNGKSFNFEEHLRGFIYAQLSALVSWKKIKENQSRLDEIFCNFDRKQLKEKSAEDLINEITAIKCHNPYTTKNQMLSLKANIETFEKIEQEYESLEKFITHSTPSNIIKLLADSNGTYKLKYAGVALVCEYLRNVGIDIIKPDRHMIRILHRLGVLHELGYNPADNYKFAPLFRCCRKLSNLTNLSQVKLDFLLWNYCATGYGEICTTKPKCEQCIIKEFCNIGKEDRIFRNLSLNIDDTRDLFVNTDKITLLKQSFKNYLISTTTNITDSTVNTYVRDAFYVFRHEHNLCVDFFDLLISKESIDNFRETLFNYQAYQRKVKFPENTTSAYIWGLHRLYNFLQEKYGGVENFINS